MKKNDVIERIREVLHIKEEDITMSTNIIDLAKDSMDIVEIIAVLSTEYNISINTVELSKLKTVQDFTDYIERAKKEQIKTRNF